jgi:hypothetical protein
MTPLRVYEANNPNWRDQMAARDRQLLMTAKAQMSENDLSWWRRTMDRLMGMFGVQRGDASED